MDRPYQHPIWKGRLYSHKTLRRNEDQQRRGTHYSKNWENNIHPMNLQSWHSLRKNTVDKNSIPMSKLLTLLPRKISHLRRVVLSCNWVVFRVIPHQPFGNT